MTRLISAESVCEGHPDKYCDSVSDRIVDLVLGADPEAHVAVDVVATTGFVALTGEIDAADPPDPTDLAALVRQRARELGHKAGGGFDPDGIEVVNRLTLSRRAKGPDPARNKADDQGMMFGYASDETRAFMPPAIHYCHRLAEWAAGQDGIGADGKIQLSLEADGAGACNRVATAVMSLQSDPDLLSLEALRERCQAALQAILPAGWIDAQSRLLLNPKGQKNRGGPDGDGGMTGRKITVDTYGGAIPHGGGAFSGKSPGKLDRTGAYAARWLALNLVAGGHAARAMVQLAYVMGEAQPAAIMVNSFGTCADDEALAKLIRNKTDLRPAALRDRLDLDRPIYTPTACFGHFGRPAVDGFFPWEKPDLVL